MPQDLGQDMPVWGNGKCRIVSVAVMKAALAYQIESYKVECMWVYFHTQPNEN